MTTATEIEHGTYNAWRYKRCRCEVCVAANEERQHVRDEARREYNRNRWHETYEGQRDYLVSQKRRWDEKNRRMVPNARSGHWTAVEDAIVLREDITAREKSAMLQRSYNSIANRKKDLLDATIDSCTHCGKPYPKVRPSKSRRPFFSRGLYCSRACVYAHQRVESAERNKRQCEHCGGEFRARRSGAKYCSQQCMGAAKVKYPETPCPECEALFKPAVTWSTRHGKTVTRFCSMRCAGIARKRATAAKRLRSCLHCGREFQSDGRTKACSRECGQRLRPDRRAVRLQDCQLCGTEFKRLNPGQKFCSRSCAVRSRYESLV